MVVKTDRKDAGGIAQLVGMGWLRPVHSKSPPAQEVRALLVARKQPQAKMRDVELSPRGLPRGFGHKVGEISKGQAGSRNRHYRDEMGKLMTICSKPIDGAGPKG